MYAVCDALYLLSTRRRTPPPPPKDTEPTIGKTLRIRIAGTASGYDLYSNSEFILAANRSTYKTALTLTIYVIQSLCLASGMLIISKYRYSLFLYTKSRQHCG